MARLDMDIQGLSSEDEALPGEKDTEYVPESNAGRPPTIALVDSQTKLQLLMDKIDGLTHSLNQFQQRQNTATNIGKRRHGPEGEDEKDLVSTDSTIYTVKLTEQPKSIVNGVMREYQLEGLNWLLKMNACKVSAILADEMGLGKTLQTISLLSYLILNGETAPSIVLVPKSTLSNWVKEFKHWAPSIQVFEFYGNLEERELLRPKVPRTNTYNVLLTTYEIAMAEKTILKGVKWNYVIVDEAHRIKNEKSVLSKIVRLFSTKLKLLITGTPLQNNLHELWSLLNFLMPEIFVSSDDFDQWFDLKHANSDNQDYLVRQLHRVLRPFMLRRLKREVESKLPPKNELYVFLGMTKTQRELYKTILTKNIEVINGFGERSQYMNTIMQLRKVCNHPYLFEGIEPGPPFVDGDHIIDACMKFKFLDKLIPKLIQNGSKVLIFTQMTRLLDILDDFLNMRGYRFCRIDGNTPYLDRESQIDEFQKADSSINLFILSTRAGGLGINLQSANTVIIYDSDWNPQVDLQAMDRAHRIGQTRTVTVYRFVTEGTVEEKIAERAAKKLKMDHLVIQKGALASQNKAPSAQEMKQILQFGAQQVLKTTGEIADEDIDTLLQYAQEKTDKLNEELKKLEETFNLKDLSFDGALLYQFEGENYKNVEKEHISLGKRNRKATGAYDMKKSLLAQKKDKSKRGWRALVGGGHPHQFFDDEELDKLDQKEENWNEYLNTKTKRRTRGDAAADKPLAFTDKDKAYRKELLNEGFANWTKREFNSFISGCEIYGKDELDRIQEEVGTKTLKEIKKYSKAFWQHYESMPNGAELVERIEQGQRDRERLSKIEAILGKKRNRIEAGEPLDYPSDPKPTHFSREEDQFLLKQLITRGYGNWDDMKSEIQMVPEFRFNIWFQSKSCDEIEKRCDYLLDILDEESESPRKHRAVEADSTDQSRTRIEVNPDFKWIIIFPKIVLT
ncbi:unnamed protein product [Blepharisma stoltei]|uniref:Uncharacterized protein n=1 Tax=Blepharisma stoltei TaxID=1481888 RepID=A0AAU9I661_9CILI|nr:unnamed protein product [Blepharisma stoltei]